MDNVKEKIAIASDHAGFQLKEKIKLNLEEYGYGVLDLGTNSEEAVDYPDYGKALAQNILKGKVKKGIALCGTGIGISIAANRFAGIRAALCSNQEMAIQARKHNNANIIALGARSIDFQCANKCIDAFLNTEFEGERHINRLEKIEKKIDQAVVTIRRDIKVLDIKVDNVISQIEFMRREMEEHSEELNVIKSGLQS